MLGVHENNAPSNVLLFFSDFDFDEFSRAGGIFFISSAQVVPATERH